MKFWLCLCFYSSVVVCGLAQQPDRLHCLEGDTLLLREFESICYRHADVKRAAAEALRFDTLPFIRKKIEAYRGQVLYRLAQPHASRPKRVVQARIHQIVKYLPQNVTTSCLRQAEQQMDSLYEALQQGTDFKMCVQRFSDDKREHWISRLEVPVELEDQAFRLKPGEVSSPFYSPLGIHLLQVLERKERMFVSDEAENPAISSMNETAFIRWISELKKKYVYTPYPAAIQQIQHQVATSQVLFTLQGEAYSGDDFALFARSYPASPRLQFEAFLAKSLLDRVLSCLEQDFPESVAAFQSHRDSLLVYEFTKHQFLQDRVWEEACLQTYFEQHRADYRYQTLKFKGVVIEAISKRAAKQVRKFLKKLPASEWKEAVRLTFGYGQHPEVHVIEGMFSLGSHPWVDYRIFKQQKPVLQSDYPVVQVLGEKIKGPLLYEEVRSKVIRDCFQHWEEQWMNHFKTNK